VPRQKYRRKYEIHEAHFTRSLVLPIVLYDDVRVAAAKIGTQKRQRARGNALLETCFKSARGRAPTTRR